MSIRIGASALLISQLALLSGCSSEDRAAGSGNASFNVWGEDYIEQEIPSGEVEDDWTIRFSKFLIVIGDVAVADRNAGSAGQISGTQLFNLVSRGPHDVGALTGLQARTWDKLGYSVPAFQPSSTVHSSASSDDASLMRSGGYSVYVAGTATKDSATKTFAWGFTNSTRYDDCVYEAEGKEYRGVSVTNGGNESVQLTIHGDHFFYDDLASREATVRFNGIAAADADNNGEVTLDELGRVKLVDMAEGTYGTGSAGNVNDLKAFVQALTVTIGHFRGEGHCAAHAL
jgi:hypothetical protein